MRKGVPILVIAFIGTIALGGAVQVADNYRQAISNANKGIVNTGEILKARIQSIKLDDPDIAKKLDEATRIEPQLSNEIWKFNILLANRQGNIVATSPIIPGVIGRDLSAIIANTRIAASGELSRIEKFFSTDTELVGVRRNFDQGQFYLYQTRQNALSQWRSLATLTTVLTLTTSFVVLILGFAFTWQSTRAREADQIYEIVRSRIDSALTVGRCGLWHLNLATGQLYWSASMFDILGLKPDDKLHPINDLSRFIHPADIELSELLSGKSIDRVFRMLHAKRGWIWIRLRCEVGQQEDETKYLLGTATELSNQKKQNEVDLNSAQVVQFEAPNTGSYEKHERRPLPLKVEELLRQHLNVDGAVELVGLANDLGVKVYTANFANGGLSSILRTQSTDAEIRAEVYLDEKLPATARRWALAKELGQYLGDIEGANSPEALRFYAMSLVLPSQPFRHAWERFGDEEALAKLFQVPNEVVRARAHDLNLHQPLQ